MKDLYANPFKHRLAAWESNFFKSEVMRNKYVRYAVMACLVLLAFSYQVTIIREALNIFPMTKEGWTIILGMSFTSLIVIQAGKKLKIAKQ